MFFRYWSLFRKKKNNRSFVTVVPFETEAAPAKKAPAKKAAPKAAPKAEAKKTEAKKEEVKTEAAPAAATSSEDLSSKTVAELKELAKAKGITGISSMKKADLIAALS